MTIEQKKWLRMSEASEVLINPFMPTVAFNICCPIDCVLGIMGEPRVPPLNPSELIVLSEHYRSTVYPVGRLGMEASTNRPGLG